VTSTRTKKGDNEESLTWVEAGLHNAISREGMECIVVWCGVVYIVSLSHAYQTNDKTYYTTVQCEDLLKKARGRAGQDKTIQMGKDGRTDSSVGCVDGCMTEEIRVIQEVGWYTFEEEQWRSDMNEEEKITITRVSHQSFPALARLYLICCIPC
jgi:maltoporin